MVKYGIFRRYKQASLHHRRPCFTRQLIIHFILYHPTKYKEKRSKNMLTRKKHDTHIDHTGHVSWAIRSEVYTSSSHYLHVKRDSHLSFLLFSFLYPIRFSQYISLKACSTTLGKSIFIVFDFYPTNFNRNLSLGIGAVPSSTLSHQWKPIPIEIHYILVCTPIIYEQLHSNAFHHTTSKEQQKNSTWYQHCYPSINTKAGREKKEWVPFSTFLLFWFTFFLVVSVSYSFQLVKKTCTLQRR